MNLLAGRRNQFSITPHVHSARPALVKLPPGPEKLTLSYLVLLEDPLDNFPLKNILKKLYWKVGARSLYSSASNTSEQI